LGESEALLQVNNVEVDFHTYAGEVKALDGVAFDIKKGEAFGLVGESGCGKSVTALSIVGLLPGNATVTTGEILFGNRNLLEINHDEMRKVRASKIAVVFQDPTTFLNPVFTIQQQLEEVFLLNPERVTAAAADAEAKGTKPSLVTQLSTSRRERAVKSLCKDVLSQVRLPETILKEYPHELSGGMKQRCMIAMALARNPELLIADEITTALDVTIQAQILELLRDLKRQLIGSTLLITHDLGIVAEVCDRVGVMYAGNVVETAGVMELFANPLHPYTQGLMRAIPMIGREKEKLETIPGAVPDLINPPSGCRFHPRCSFAFEKCKLTKPELIQVGKDHTVACHLYGVEKP